MREHSRSLDALRSVQVEPGFHRASEGSALYRAGGTVVLCTVSIDDKVPSFLEGKGRGWLTAEYQMHPRANRKRQDRDGRGRPLGGRTQEIQRLIGRALRAAVNLDAIGERTVVIDCDVLEADGGTRTASITGGFIALALALARVTDLYKLPAVLREPVAAISVGYLGEKGVALDLVYTEDAAAEVDLNVVATESGKIVEVQGTAEGEPIARHVLDSMIDMGIVGVRELAAIQRAALARAGVNLDTLLVRK